MWSVWIVFCDCGFHSVCPLMEKDKRLMEASWWERLTEGEIGFCSDGPCSIYLYPIFYWWVGCWHDLLFDMSPNYGGGNEDNGKRSHAFTAAFSALDPAGGHCQPTSLPTHTFPGESWWLTGSLGQSLVGSLLLSPGTCCAQGFVCALQESVSPVLCKFWQFYGGATSSKTAYAMPRSAVPRAPAPVAGHCWPISLQETLKHSSASVSGLFLETLEKNHDAPRHTDYCSLVLQETILPIIRVSIAEKAVE